VILKADQILRELENPRNPADPLVVTPIPQPEHLRNSGAGSIDLRLGCWFLGYRQNRVGLIDVYERHADAPSEARLTKTYYVPFGQGFVLHPRAFVLGVTLEWIRLPCDRAGYVVGRSSWGRHGLIIATATGVHPGFTGCLTLELTNVGEVPITVKPGTTICQLFLHEAMAGLPDQVDRSVFVGRRKPTLGSLELDETASKLSREVK
jgi:dCTP deaminase